MSDKPPTSQSVDTDALVDKWHAETFAGSAVAHDASIWNLVHAAKDDLKLRLTAALSPATT